MESATAQAKVLPRPLAPPEVLVRPHHETPALPGNPIALNVAGPRLVACSA